MVSLEPPEKTTSEIMVDNDCLDYFKPIGEVDDPDIRRQQCGSRSACTDPFPKNFEPGEGDVICCGGKEAFEHVGNKQYRMYIANNAAAYRKADSRLHKSFIVSSIIETVKERTSVSRYGGFLKRDIRTGRWYQLDKKASREKVSHALREAIKVQQRKEARERPDTSSGRILARKLRNECIQEEHRPEMEQCPSKQPASTPSNLIAILPESSFPCCGGAAGDDRVLSNMACVATCAQGLTSSVGSQLSQISDDDDDGSLAFGLVASISDNDDDCTSTISSSATGSAHSNSDWERSLKESNERFSRPEEKELSLNFVA
ncbi:unnamed protein product [Cylindrotheca closterium]|uniref:DUF6824 domain-containing protein n=1 Tax=Cylindrotheca closterium TaxID=2856 RepID=A0AAD2CGZ4_9STRA|nr:unnamed protein product [Cylindrotheca closterium]